MIAAAANIVLIAVGATKCRGLKWSGGGCCGGSGGGGGGATGIATVEERLSVHRNVLCSAGLTVHYPGARYELSGNVDRLDPHS